MIRMVKTTRSIVIVTLMFAGLVFTACGKKSPTSPQTENGNENTVRGKNWQVTVHSWWNEEQLSGFGKVWTPKEGYVFLLIDLEFKNLQAGTEKVTLDSRWAIVTDSEDNSYSVIGALVTADEYNIGFSWVTIKMQAGSSTRETWVYVVPLEAKGFKFRFLDYTPIDLKP